MMKKRGQGQSWSLDIILAFVIFILIIAFFYAVLSNHSTIKSEHLQLEASAIANNIDSSTGMNSTLAVVEKGTLDVDKLEKLYNSSYDSVKSQFGLKGDFCIYIVDQYGNLVAVQTDKGEMNGFGNGNISVNGKPCGSTI